MNPIRASVLGSALVAIGLLSGCKGSQAPESTATAPTPAPQAAPAAATPVPAPEATAAEPTATPTSIPGSADAIWQAIDQHNAELKATIATGDLAQVHHHAFAIRDLVAALPAHSPTLPADAQAKLKSEIQFVSTLADRLDESGDAGDRAGSQASYDQLVAVLAGITRTK
jgi:hypothetical protein